MREPEAVRAGAHLIFPDFAIFHRRDPARCVLLEIAGFWTPDYLAKKLERLRDVGVTNLILCVDESLNCAGATLPDAYTVVRYKRRIDAKAVMIAVEKLLDGTRTGSTFGDSKD